MQLIYATAGKRIGRLGTIESALPIPDILVTHSRWDVFLPEGMAYGSPSTNMEIVGRRDHVSREALQAELARLEDAAVVHQAIRPLRITVPASGIRFAFEKLYANQRDQRAWFELPYASASGAALGQSASVVGALLFWAGLGLFLRATERSRRLAAVATSTAGLALAAVAVGVYHVSATPALVVSLLALVGIGAVYARRMLPEWRMAGQS